MRLATRPARRALLCVLVFALWFATTLGVLHRSVHGLGASQATAATVIDEGRAAPAAHGLSALFGAHGDADCRLYDQLSQGAAALGVPILVLPGLLPVAVFLYLEGEALARWAALFDARGPPSAR